jgi:hypothetical protein
METEIRAARAAEKRPVYTPALVQKWYSKAWLARETDEDKDCITFSLPPFSGLPIIFV